VLLGGGPTDMPTLERASKLGVAIVQSYGMTETASQVVALAGEDAVRKLGSVGKPLFPVEIRVKTTADAQTGRVQVKSPTLTVGYLNNEAKYQAAFDDGWFDTGDMGWFDEEGYLYIQGREGDMISSGGENVFPDEIESAYAALPEIETIAVAGVPDEKWGAVPVAYIKFVPGQSLTQATLRAFGRQQLAHFKVPAKFVTVTDFPRTASGKLQRHLLAEQSFEIIL
jgi:O-succinylbenzoic acid--CoA ligase